MQLDSASQKPLNGPKTDLESFYLGEVKIDQPSEDSGLKSKKWILAMFIESIASIFTVLGILTADQWLWITGAIATGYGILNVGQKKLLQ